MEFAGMKVLLHTLIASSLSLCCSGLAMAEIDPANNPVQNSNDSRINLQQLKDQPANVATQSNDGSCNIFQRITASFRGNKGETRMPSNAVEPTKQGNLLEIELTISGGMLGIQNRTLFDFKTVPATLTVKKKPHFEAPEQTYRMVLTEEQAAQIKGQLSGIDIAAWSHAPTSEFVVLDAPSVTLHFRVDRKPSFYNISDIQELSQSNETIRQALMKKIHEFEKLAMQSPPTNAPE